MAKATIPILAMILVLPFCPVSARSQEKGREHAKSAAPCHRESASMPGSYYWDVISQFEPPHFEKYPISIAEGAEIKIVLVADGDKFEMWTDTPQISEKGVNAFLWDLAEHCRLPLDPADAAKMIKLKWEKVDLSAAQFAELHRQFTEAATSYASRAQNRYAPLLSDYLSGERMIHLDGFRYPIVYDNQQEHIELQVWDTAGDPMVKWVHDLKQLAESSFHRSFGSADAAVDEKQPDPPPAK
jgi:hypothetical protein